MQLSDDNLYEVDGVASPTEIELFSKHGDKVTTVRILPQLIDPEAIVLGDRCFVRRPDGRYCELFAVAAIGEC